MGASIFAAAHPRSVLRARVASAEPVASATAAPLAAACAPSLDAALLGVLISPLKPGETSLLGYARKEAELRTAFATLSVLGARAMGLRLSACKADDALALAFSRLTLDRRTRLLQFLDDARRREALAGARRK